MRGEPAAAAVSRIARSTLKESLDRAVAAGPSREAAEAPSEEELDRRLFAAAEARDAERGACLARHRLPVARRTATALR